MKLPQTLLALSLLASLVGCGSSRKAASIPRWQKSVETYVRQQGNGDPTILRDVTVADERTGFALIGGPSPRNSTDAIGLLLGHPQVGAERWFVYLVALVDERRARDVRLAAMADAGDGKMQWVVGQKDEQALETYLKHREDRWRSLFPDRKDPPLNYTGFPTEGDTFQLDVSGDRLTATHEASGATWELTVPPTRRSQVAHAE
jgi:hypothetical protein